MNEDLATIDDRKEIWKRIEQARVCFFTSLSEDNGLRARPLTTQCVETETRLWFFIERYGDLANDVKSNPRALVTYSVEADRFYASLTGRARVYVDPEKARELWSQLNEAWFPGGPDDPNLALLRVDVDHGETWQPTTNKLTQFLSIAPAAVMRTASPNEGVNKTFQ
jgi:general stress protein 26